ncbi:MAG: hypothetical protein ACYDCO_15915 [Armatimonadota bacterium]
MPKRWHYFTALISAFLLLLHVACFLPAALATQVKVPDGIPVHVKMLQTLVSGETKENSLVNFTVTQDVVVANRVVIAKGARATGRVTLSRERGALGKSGSLEFTLDSVLAVDKSRISLRPNFQGGDGMGHGAGVIVGAVFLSVFMLLINGRDITVKEGTELTGYVDGTYAINQTEEGISGEETLSAPDATLTLIEKTAMANAVSGKMRNEGPEPAAAEVVILVEKDGKAVGVGKVLTAVLNPNEEALFSVDIEGSTDGNILLQINAKPAAGSDALFAPPPTVTLLSKIVTAKGVAGQVLNDSEDTIDVTLKALCLAGEKFAGSGSVTLRKLAPGETRNYRMTITGRTTTNVTLETKVRIIKPRR